MVSDTSLIQPDVFGPRSFSEILESSFNMNWATGSPEALESVGNFPLSTDKDSVLYIIIRAYCLKSVPLSFLTDSNSTYKRVIAPGH